jgi:hypothetical protein
MGLLREMVESSARAYIPRHARPSWLRAWHTRRLAYSHLGVGDGGGRTVPARRYQRNGELRAASTGASAGRFGSPRRPTNLAGRR